MDIKSHLASKDYELIQEDMLHQGFFQLVRRHLRFRQFRGDFSQIITRDIMIRKTAAGVLPYDPINDKVVLIEQFRAGAIDKTPISPWLFEVVAGLLDEYETPEELSVREAKEEAGVTLLNLEPICDYFVSPGGSNEYFHLYCGQIEASFTEGFYGLAHEHEDIRAISLPIEQAFDLLKSGQIKTAPLIIALQWLKLNQTWLKQLWQTK